MELKNFKEAIEFQIYNFIENESFLLENDVNERTITHKLAEYLKDLFLGYNVDCEYNRMDWGTTDYQRNSKRLNLKTKKIDSADPNWTTVFPDIIVHKRWNNDDNFLIIEIKKKGYAEKELTHKYDSLITYRDFDKYKIEAYMRELKYKNGLYLEFNWKKISKIEWFRET